VVTIVRALWGDEHVANWPKALRDAQLSIAGQPKPPLDHLIFGYGQQNLNFLRNCGVDAVLANKAAIVDFSGCGNRDTIDRSPYGQVNYGLSMWIHKIDSIHQAFQRGVEEVVWLDWDVIYRNPDGDVLERLNTGPDFQGRLRSYHRSPTVYCGACWYFRSAALVQDIFDAMLTLRDFSRTDEYVATERVSRKFFDGEASSWERHRQAGLDNPYLFDVRSNAVPSDCQSVFYKGAGASRTPRWRTVA